MNLQLLGPNIMILIGLQHIHSFGTNKNSEQGDLRDLKLLWHHHNYTHRTPPSMCLTLHESFYWSAASGIGSMYISLRKRFLDWTPSCAASCCTDRSWHPCLLFFSIFGPLSICLRAILSVSALCKARNKALLICNYLRLVCFAIWPCLSKMLR